MSAPKPFTLKALLPGADPVAFINGSLMLVLRLMWQKLAGMMNDPGEYSVATWQNGTWRSVCFGTAPVTLPDADSLIDPLNGTVYVATDATLTADHLYQPVVSGNYDRLTFWNLSTLYTLTIDLAAGDMTLPPGYAGVIHGNPVAFVGSWREPVRVDP